MGNHALHRFQHGQNYLNAIISILPSQLTGYHESLSNWFAYKLLPGRAAKGVAFGFSAVAEGYINARMLGVVIHGLLIGLVGSVIK